MLLELRHVTSCERLFLTIEVGSDVEVTYIIYTIKATRPLRNSLCPCVPGARLADAGDQSHDKAGNVPSRIFITNAKIFKT